MSTKDARCPSLNAQHEQHPQSQLHISAAKYAFFYSLFVLVSLLCGLLFAPEWTSNN